VNLVLFHEPRDGFIGGLELEVVGGVRQGSESGERLQKDSLYAHRFGAAGIVVTRGRVCKRVRAKSKRFYVWACAIVRPAVIKGR
jgi:hypothetical protein